MGGQAWASQPSPGRESGKVEKVEDGDTIKVKIGKKTYTVQYAAISAPDGKRPFGKESKKVNEKLVKKKMVELEQDITEKDTKKRLVR